MSQLPRPDPVSTTVAMIGSTELRTGEEMDFEKLVTLLEALGDQKVDCVPVDGANQAWVLVASAAMACQPLPPPAAGYFEVE